MLDLLQYFRTNKYCMLSDIGKAFLMIRLKSERDKNKFSFVVFDGKDYQYYRYNTIIFGFVTSPYVLNYVIKHIANKCNNSFIKNLISSKFYVDNLVLTSNDDKELCGKFSEISFELSRSGLNLRDCLSNNTDILSNLDDSKVCSNKMAKNSRVCL